MRSPICFTFYEGLSEYFMRKERSLYEKQEYLRKQILEDEVIVNEIIIKMKAFNARINERKKLCQMTDSSLTTLRKLRNIITRALQSIDLHLQSKETKKNPTGITHALRTLEAASMLENVPLAVLRQKDDKSSQYLSIIDDKLSKLVMMIANDTDKSHKESLAYQKQELMFSRVYDMLHNVCKTSKSIWDCENTLALSRIHEFVRHNISKAHIFSRPLPQDIFVFRSIRDDPYEDNETVLDGIIASGEADDYFWYQLTFKYFSNASDLLTNIITRYCIAPLEVNELVNTIQAHQERVIEFLASWINRFPNDFQGRFPIDVKYFVNNVVIPSGNIQGGRKVLLALESRKKKLIETKTCSMYWESFLCHRSERKKIEILSVPTKDFAKQLALLEHRLYVQLQYDEFIGQKWVVGNENRASHAPTIVEYSNHYNNITNWIIELILNLKEVEQRARVIEFFIEIIIESYQLQNFFGALIIYFALNSVSIYRLSETWKLVPEPQRYVLFVISRYTADGLKLYKSELKNVTGASVPYIGTVLSDITFLEDGNPTFSKDNRINFHFKCRKVYSSIRSVLRFQSESYHFSPDSDILSFIHHECTQSHRHSEEERYQISVELEKSGTVVFDFEELSTEEIMNEMKLLQKTGKMNVSRSFSIPKDSLKRRISSFSHTSLSRNRNVHRANSVLESNVNIHTDSRLIISRMKTHNSTT